MEKSFLLIPLVMGIVLIAGCTQSSPSGQVIKDPCANVECNNYCYNSTLYYNGQCTNGQCTYKTKYCNYGCDNNQCFTPSVSQLCSREGKTFCNGGCYSPCPSGQTFICPPSREPTCKTIYSIEDVKKSLVYIEHNVTACCDSHGKNYSLVNNSGSGVVYYRTYNTVYILTNRHVVDCVFAGTCLYPEDEKIFVHAQNGFYYFPFKILLAPGNLDLAIIEILTSDNIGVTNLTFDYSVGDEVTAIGYSVFKPKPNVSTIIFSTEDGIVTNIYNFTINTNNLTTYDGPTFTGIESNALTHFGGSGGLFTQDGYLVGIITFGNRGKEIALGSNVTSREDSLTYCSPGTYHAPNSEWCCPFGTLVGSDGLCHQPCGGLTRYCQSGYQCSNGKCYKS